MQEHQQEYQSLAQTTTTDDALLVALDKLEICHEQAEYWPKQVEQLKQELQEFEQELRYTNAELSAALLSQEIQFELMKQLAQKIVAANTSVSESLAVMLSAIYHRVVNPEELELVAQFSPVTESSVKDKADEIVANSRDIRETSQRLRTQHKQLEIKLVAFQAKFRNLYNLTELLSQSKEKNITHLEKIKNLDGGKLLSL